MAGFLKGGPRPGSRISGPPKGAREFLSHSSSSMLMPRASAPPMHDAGGEKTEITHHPDGATHPETGEPIKHTVHHADGEVSHHPNAGHMAAHIHAKHEGGEVGNMHSDGMGTVTTHHVGPDGEVNGPEDHPSPEEGASHLASMMSGEENEMPNDNEPDGDKGESYG